jgi:hypothetical protein
VIGGSARARQLLELLPAGVRDRLIGRQLDRMEESSS